MGAPRTCLIFITIHLVSLAYTQEVSKRVPQGFLGMRGKKYFDEDGTEQFYKRKPQFFVGVKGKKSLQDILEAQEEYNKRAPMGFMGMRGKKDLNFLDSQSNELPKRDGSLIGQIDYTSKEEPNDPQFPLLNELLMLMAQANHVNPKINFLPDSLDSSLEAAQVSFPQMNDVGKRVANFNQFYGVRGKKSINTKRPYDLTFRGKFIGVRGKKDVKNSGAHEIKFLVDQNGPLPKRKAQMGFFGMRGKKWADEPSLEMEMPN